MMLRTCLRVGASIGVFLIGAILLPGPARTAPEPAGSPHVVAASDLVAGRYLIVIGGCNDCHTEGYRQSAGKTPEADWLTGRKAGFFGPWGTTYAANLRLTAAALDEDGWVAMLRTRRDAPPMPWMNINQLDERDARAIYRYLRALGAKGDPAPARLPPGAPPAGPYQSMGIIDPSAAPRG